MLALMLLPLVPVDTPQQICYTGLCLQVSFTQWHYPPNRGGNYLTRRKHTCQCVLKCPRPAQAARSLAPGMVLGSLPARVVLGKRVVNFELLLSAELQCPKRRDDNVRQSQVDRAQCDRDIEHGHQRVRPSGHARAAHSRPKGRRTHESTRTDQSACADRSSQPPRRPSTDQSARTHEAARADRRACYRSRRQHDRLWHQAAG